MIKKEDFLSVNGFDVSGKNIYEDWYLWLIDPINNFSAMDELLTPAFFMLGE